MAENDAPRTKWGMGADAAREKSEVPKPSVGRIVHSFGSAGGLPVAAIVTEVIDDEAMNVRLTLFRPGEPPRAPEGSVPHISKRTTQSRGWWDWPVRE